MQFQKTCFKYGTDTDIYIKGIIHFKIEVLWKQLIYLIGFFFSGEYILRQILKMWIIEICLGTDTT